MLWPVKFTHNGEIRRIKIEVEGHCDGISCESFRKVKILVAEMFPKLYNKPYFFVWQDEEGDQIITTSCDEFSEAVDVQSRMSDLLKFEIKLRGEATKSADTISSHISSQFIHIGVACDECNVDPIQGARYKCTIRADYDLCETCEAKKIQPHAMIKITDPSQAPEVFGFTDRFNPKHGCIEPRFIHTEKPKKEQFSPRSRANSVGSDNSSYIPNTRFSSRFEEAKSRDVMLTEVAAASGAADNDFNVTDSDKSTLPLVSLLSSLYQENKAKHYNIDSVHSQDAAEDYANYITELVSHGMSEKSARVLVMREIIKQGHVVN